jgi:hypothetical protein
LKPCAGFNPSKHLCWRCLKELARALLQKTCAGVASKHLRGRVLKNLRGRCFKELAQAATLRGLQHCLSCNTARATAGGTATNTAGGKAGRAKVTPNDCAMTIAGAEVVWKTISKTNPREDPRGLQPTHFEEF